MRKHATDNSSAVSLFPFIAVLLCTMGALFVVLVAVTRIARERAQQRAAAEQSPPDPSPDDSEARKKLDRIGEYLARIREARQRMQQALRDDKLRLSHLEEHMRRLQDRMGVLHATAAELDALDEEHYDDRRQAKRELDRLRQLAADMRQTVDSLRDEARSKKQSFAIVPYEGPHGTQRRPIYIECRKDKVILQPEGINLTPDDFMEPVDVGNPLAAALRAAREYWNQESAGDASSEPTDAYPLILIRPDGIETYYDVRGAVASWDADFGYEFVDGNWELKFQPANLVLAKIEYQAIEQARIRRRVLAAAAPRAFRPRGAFGGDRGDFEDGGGGIFGDGASGGFGQEASGDGSARGGLGLANSSPGESNAIGGASGRSGRAGLVESGDPPSAPAGFGPTSGAAGSRNAGADSYGGASPNTIAVSSADTSGASMDGSASAGPPNAASPAAASNMAGNASGSPNGQVGGTATTEAGPAGSASTAAAGASDMSAGSPTASSGTGSPSAAGNNGTNDPAAQVVEISPTPAAVNIARSRGPNWALGGKGQSAVPVRRSIQVVVREDRVAFLPERGASVDASAGGREVPLPGPIAAHVDDIVTAIQEHVRDWGMAGHGLYWRPVLVLHVGPGGERRADELAQLLKDSGIELRSSRPRLSARPGE